MTQTVEDTLARIAAREASVRAFVHFDAEAVRAASAQAPAGRLSGFAIGVKDVLDTFDMPSEYGSPIWAGHRPRADAAAVAWVRAAGGVVAGKTVTTEFATRQPGRTTNPHNAGHTPGGSSSGSAAAVGAGMIPMAFGTQTAGSVIRPAAYCGAVGYKPSYGLIPRLGMKVMSDSLDTIGVIADSVAHCALLASVASCRDLGDPNAKPDRAPHIGLCHTPMWDRADAVTQALMARVADTVARAGAKVAACELPAAFAAMEQAHPIVMNAESARSMAWELATAPGLLSAGLRERLEWGLSLPETEIADALATFIRLQNAFPGAMDGFDILLTPSAQGEAPAGLEWTGDPVFNAMWTALHVPCVTVPAGIGPNGLPLGIQIVGRRGEDRQVLAWAQWVAEALAG